MRAGDGVVQSTRITPGGSGATQPGFYSNWNAGEPNNSYGPEDYLQFNFGGPGGWNDSRNSGNSTTGYFVEYSPAVPEPAAWAMMLTGFLMTGVALRKRSSRISVPSAGR